MLQELKTEKSRWTLILPNVSVTALKEQHKGQLEERLKAGDWWIDSGLSPGDPINLQRIGGRRPQMRCA